MSDDSSILELIDPANELQQLDRYEATTSFRTFVRKAWPIVEPAKPYIHNWHVDAIAYHLEAITRGEIRRLLINIPPGCAKSLLVAVLWPAWVWIQPDGRSAGPKWRALFASYAFELSTRDSLRCRMLIESDWYKNLFAPSWRIRSDQNRKSYFINTELGFRRATSVGGSATGFRGHCIVADDPLNAKKAHSAKAREEVLRWWDHVMSSRLDDKAEGARVVIMQRLHERDLAGHLQEQEGWEHLCIPMEYEPERHFHTSLGDDPRKNPGELLFDELFPEDIIEETKREMGSAEYAGQYQQRPTPEGGGILKQYWWKYWKPKGMDLPPVMVRMANGELKAIEAVERPDDKQFDEVIMSVGCTFKETHGSDYVAIGIWGRKGADKYLLDQGRDRMDCPRTMQAIRGLSVKFVAARAAPVQDETIAPCVVCQRRHLIQILRYIRSMIEPRPLPAGRGEQIQSRILGLAAGMPGELITRVIQAGRPVHSHAHNAARRRNQRVHAGWSRSRQVPSPAIRVIEERCVLHIRRWLGDGIGGSRTFLRIAAQQFRIVAGGEPNRPRHHHAAAHWIVRINAPAVIGPRLSLECDSSKADAVIPGPVRRVGRGLHGPPCIRFEVVGVHIAAAVTAMPPAPVQNQTPVRVEGGGSPGPHRSRSVRTFEQYPVVGGEAVEPRFCARVRHSRAFRDRRLDGGGHSGGAAQRFRIQPVFVRGADRIKDVAAGPVFGRARIGDQHDHATLRRNIGAHIKSRRHFAGKVQPAVPRGIVGPHIGEIPAVVAAADQDPPGVRIIHGEMPGARGRSGRSPRFPPCPRLHVVQPGVGKVMALAVAAEKDQQLVLGIANQS